MVFGTTPAQIWHHEPLFYELSDSFGKQRTLENIDDKIARKNDSGLLNKCRLGSGLQWFGC